MSTLLTKPRPVSATIAMSVITKIADGIPTPRMIPESDLIAGSIFRR